MKTGKRELPRAERGPMDISWARHPVLVVNVREDGAIETAMDPHMPQSVDAHSFFVALLAQHIGKLFDVSVDSVLDSAREWRLSEAGEPPFHPRIRAQRPH